MGFGPQGQQAYRKLVNFSLWLPAPRGTDQSSLPSLRPALQVPSLGGKKGDTGLMGTFRNAFSALQVLKAPGLLWLQVEGGSSLEGKPKSTQKVALGFRAQTLKPDHLVFLLQAL